ncbi:hypothetical protein EDB85DRAFT_2057497 [Lactarius pseudohatsudake]|nr:hypothetical protein EDB85DRAFT_2057497 [Lactarius pseudohatsudake]
MMLGRLPQDSCTFFIARLAGALVACSHRKSPESSELASMRRQVVDVLTTILSFFIQVAPSDAQVSGSCEILLHTCLLGWKEQQTNWTIPAPLVSLMNKSPESKRVADLSRVCLQALLFCPCPLRLKRKAGGQAPGMPQEQNGTQKLSIRGQHVHQRRHPKDITSSSSPQQSMCSGVSTPVEAADDGD